VTSLLQALAGADAILAVSEFVRAVFVRHGMPETALRVVPPTLALDGVTWRLRRVHDRPVRFGFLGRAVPMKGAHVLARAVRDVPPQGARFLFFGAASPESQRHLHALAGAGRLEFRGAYARRDLPQVLDGLDVAVVPSVVQETVGLTSIEAQAAGIPVLGAHIGAIPEHVTDNENGLLFAPGDHRDLHHKIMQVIGAPSMVEAMSARTRRPVPITDHLDALLDIYAAVARGRRAVWTASSA
jgi:glycosyltransferase involved in cell wall biosynthesis